MHIPEETIAEIKARTDLRDLVESYGIQTRRAGSDYKALCPFHHEKTPSFSINQRTGHWHCYGCGEHGDVFQFVQRREGLGFADAVRRLAARCGIEIKEDEKDEETARLRRRLYDLHTELSAFFRRCLVQAKEGERARNYLRDRGLDGKVAEDFEIGYVPQSASALTKWARKHGYENPDLEAAGVLLPPKDGDGGQWYSRFAGRLAFPIRDRMGRVVAFSCRTLENDKAKMVGGKYVNSPETVVFKKSDVLYGMDKAAPHVIESKGREIIICEGQIDVIRLHSAGFNTAVAAQGTAFTKEHVRQIRRCADSAMLVFDGDGAGRKAAVKAARLLLEAEIPVRAARMPPGEDPDSLIRSNGAKAMKEVLASSTTVAAFLAESLMSSKEDDHLSDDERKMWAAKETLELIGHCRSAVMRESLMEETARITGFTVDALRSDLSQQKPVVREKDATTQPPPLPVPQKIATVTPSDIPLAERCLCLLLIENEGKVEMEDTVRRILSTKQLTDFARSIIRVWLEGNGLAAAHAESKNSTRTELERLLVARRSDYLPHIAPERIVQDFERVLPSI